MESKDQFDRQAALYATSTVHSQGASLPVLVEYADPKLGEKALDVATGTGNTAFALAEKGADVVGVDVSEGMLEQARGKGSPVRFVQGEAENLPFDDGSFDLVTARHAPHHFRDAGRFLAEVRRVLRPGGRFVMADGVSPTAEASAWFDRWQRLRDPSHFYSRTVDEWRALFDEVGGFVWTRDTLVPYRLEFGWWTRQSGTSPETIAELERHAASAPASIREAAGVEMEGDRPLAFHEPMLVVRLERP